MKAKSEGSTHPGSVDPGSGPSLEAQIEAWRMEFAPSDCESDLVKCLTGRRWMCLPPVAPFGLSPSSSLWIDALAQQSVCFPADTPASNSVDESVQCIFCWWLHFWLIRILFLGPMSLLQDPLWEIRIKADLLSRVQGSMWHPCLEMWKLWTYKLSPLIKCSISSEMLENILNARDYFLLGANSTIWIWEMW